MLTVPQFAVRESRSLEGTPTIDVTFDDGYTDTFVLDNFYFAEEDKLARKENCDYIGHLAGDLNTCVAVTGCAGYQSCLFQIRRLQAITQNSIAKASNSV